MRADARARLDLAWIRIDEETDIDARVVHALATLGQRLDIWNDVEAAFGGDFLAAFGNDANRVRTDASREIDHFGRIGHFKIQARFD